VAGFLLQAINAWRAGAESPSATRRKSSWAAAALSAVAFGIELPSVSTS
jgi:hypothetical protein